MDIKKVVVIGSGTMGSGIAAHLCNAKIPVTLLDLTTEISEKARDRIFKSKPPLLLDKSKIDKIKVGNRELEVWHTPGHTDSQLAFRFGNLLLSGDNIYRDGSVGAIDAHHGSDIPSFISSLERIAASDIEWLLPSHGPIFRKDDELLAKTISRLKGYLTLADFGTCATHWPLMDDWDKELAEGRLPSERTQTA